MKLPTPLTAGKSMLGAALAGLSLVSTDAEAAVYLESTDFSNDFNTPTDLRSTFGNFLDNHGIIGSLTIDSADYSDYIELTVAPSTMASINFIASSTVDFSNFQLNAFNSSNSLISFFYLYMPVSGTTHQGTLTFETPANGVIKLQGNSSELSSGTINYSIGTIPEPTSAILGIAGLAAAALRRRRNEK